MKKLSILAGVCLFASIALPSWVEAQNQGIGYENAAALNEATPDSPELQTPQLSLGHAIDRLSGTESVDAGVPMKDSKELTTPSVAPTSDSDDGFSAPEAYSEYKYAHIQDNRTIGFDGPQHNGIVGFDFQSFWKSIIGFNFTYTNTSLTTNLAPASFYNSSNAYFFSNYVAKNFDDWVNVGGSFTYGRTDSTFRANFSPPFAVGQKTTQDTFALSPFIGAAHTFGAYSFSSTATYIWGYDHFSFNTPTINNAPAGLAPPDAKTLNQTFLWLNNVQYAIDDKWSVSVQANYNRLLTTQSVPTLTSPLTPPLGHQWMSFGARADYSFNKDGSVFAAFEHDAFNTHFDDYRIRTGISYNF